MRTVKLVIVNIEKCARLLERPERFSSKARLDKCASIKNERVRMQGYGAELALSYALSGSKLEPPEYRCEESGKPVIESGFISLSHSGNFAVCAYSPVPVGVDIEEYREVSPAAAKRILTESELSEFARAGSKYLIDRFVMKEAFLKLTGEGVFGGMDRVFEKDGRIFRDGVSKAFSFRFGDGYAGCAAACEECDFSLEEL